MPDFTENDLAAIEHDRDLPPDEPYPSRDDEPSEEEDDAVT